MNTLTPPIEATERQTGKSDKSEGARLPVHILTGFLGAGKTTCLNAFLRSAEAAQTAVLVNEFGQIDVDGAVLSAQLGDGSRLVTLPNGCVCCAVQDDLVAALVDLSASAAGRLSDCVIETTGLADPGAIIRGAHHDPRLRRIVVIGRTVTVCAADRIGDQLSRFVEPGRQIGIADRIILTKCGLVSAERRSEAQAMIRAINPLVEIIEAGNGNVEAGSLFGSIEADARRQDDLRHPQHDHHHSHSVASFAICLERPLDADRFRDVMSFMIMRHAENLLRIKGIVRFAGSGRPQVLNGVHDVFSSEPAPVTSGPSQGPGSIVVIGVDLPEASIRTDIESCQI